MRKITKAQSQKLQTSASHHSLLRIKAHSQCSFKPEEIIWQPWKTGQLLRKSRVTAKKVHCCQDAGTPLNLRKSSLIIDWQKMFIGVEEFLNNRNIIYHKQVTMKGFGFEWATCFIQPAVHNVYFVKYDVTVSFLAQVLDTVTYLVPQVLDTAS